jgi:DNA (cytosine-5)-methyltransferase 1
VVLVENVPEFRQWVLFPAWAAAMAALGYTASPHVVDAADFGTPQNRVRLFMVFTRSRAPLILKLQRRRWRG